MAMKTVAQKHWDSWIPGYNPSSGGDWGSKGFCLVILLIVPQWPASPACCFSLSDLPLTSFSVTGSLIQFLVHLLSSLTSWANITSYFTFGVPSSAVRLNHPSSAWNGWARRTCSLLLPLPWGQRSSELVEPCIRIVSLMEIHRALISPCWSLFWKSDKDF